MVRGDPGILGGAGEAGEEDNLADGVVVGGAGGIGLGGGRAGEVAEAAVVGGEGVGGRGAADLFAVGAEERDAVEQLLLVSAHPATNVGLGQQRHVIQPRDLGSGEHGTPRVILLVEPERQAVMADQPRHRRAPGEGRRLVQPGTSPQEVVGETGAGAGVPRRGNPPIRLDPRAAGLGDVVEQGRAEEEAALGRRQGAPGVQGS